MYIDVVYSKKVTFEHVKKASESFFSSTEYIEQNFVFTHPKEDSVFFLKKNALHIRIPNDIAFIQLTDSFLKYVFNGNRITVMTSDATGFPTC